MGRGETAGGSPLRRVRRRVGLDRNPLRRRVDKIETYVVLVLVALFTLAAPVAAWRTGQVAYRDGV